MPTAMFRTMSATLQTLFIVLCETILPEKKMEPIAPRTTPDPGNAGLSFSDGYDGRTGCDDPAGNGSGKIQQTLSRLHSRLARVWFIPIAVEVVYTVGSLFQCGARRQVLSTLGFHVFYAVRKLSIWLIAW